MSDQKDFSFNPLQKGFSYWPVFAALGQSSGRDFDIKVPSFQRRPPNTVLAFRAAGLKEQEAHSAVGRGGLLKNQQLSILEDREEKCHTGEIHSV